MPAQGSRCGKAESSLLYKGDTPSFSFVRTLSLYVERGLINATFFGYLHALRFSTETRNLCFQLLLVLAHLFRSVHAQLADMLQPHMLTRCVLRLQYPYLLPVIVLDYTSPPDTDLQSRLPVCIQITLNQRDTDWETYTCILGFPVMGIWPPESDGTDINSVDRSKNCKVRWCTQK
jgi:hypothetical protein